MEAVFDATPAQIEIMEHPALIKIAVCGRRWGKTVMMAIYLAATALRHPDCTVWYVSPRYARSLKMMRIMRKCKPFMELVSATHMQFPPRFELKNGAEIAFISADTENELRGEGLRLVCVDETSVLTKHLFYEVLLPMTMDSDGTILAGSTYNGRNWFYDLANGGMDGENTKTWVYPTSSGIRFRGEKGLARLERFKAVTPPMVWQQECECEPLAQVDAVFRYIDQCIVKRQPLMQPIPGHRYVCSQDIGRIVDKSAVVVMDLDTGDVTYFENYALGTPHREQANRTKHIAAFWNDALICLDTTGGGAGGYDETCIEEYAKVLNNFRAITQTMDTKRNMVNRLDMDFETQKISIPDTFTELISQLKLYRYQYGEKAIHPTYFGKPDDGVSALYMATWARKEKWGPELSGRPIRIN